MRISKIIHAVDAHACGEPGRVIVGGVLDVPGSTIFEKKNYLEQNADWLRKLKLLEAREPVTKLTLETPAGLVEVEAAVANGKVTNVTFRNVPAFAVHLDTPVEVPKLGTVIVDVAFGGMFYVIA